MPKEVEETRLEDLHPTYRKIASVIGVENAVKLGRLFGGLDVYFPKVDALISRKAKHRMIFEEFDGRNYADLARKHGLSETWIRKIIERQRGRKQDGA